MAEGGPMRICARKERHVDISHDMRENHIGRDIEHEFV